MKQSIKSPIRKRTIKQKHPPSYENHLKSENQSLKMQIKKLQTALESLGANMGLSPETEERREEERIRERDTPPPPHSIGYIRYMHHQHANSQTSLYLNPREGEPPYRPPASDRIHQLSISSSELPRYKGDQPPQGHSLPKRGFIPGAGSQSGVIGGIGVVPAPSKGGQLQRAGYLDIGQRRSISSKIGGRGLGQTHGKLLYESPSPFRGTRGALSHRLNSQSEIKSRGRNSTIIDGIFDTSPHLISSARRGLTESEDIDIGRLSRVNEHLFTKLITDSEPRQPKSVVRASENVLESEMCRIEENTHDTYSETQHNTGSSDSSNVPQSGHPSIDQALRSPTSEMIHIPPQRELLPIPPTSSLNPPHNHNSGGEKLKDFLNRKYEERSKEYTNSKLGGEGKLDRYNNNTSELEIGEIGETLETLGEMSTESHVKTLNFNESAIQQHPHQGGMCGSASMRSFILSPLPQLQTHTQNTLSSNYSRLLPHEGGPNLKQKIQCLQEENQKLKRELLKDRVTVTSSMISTPTARGENARVDVMGTLASSMATTIDEWKFFEKGLADVKGKVVKELEKKSLGTTLNLPFTKKSNPPEPSLSSSTKLLHVFNANPTKDLSDIRENQEHPNPKSNSNTQKPQTINPNKQVNNYGVDRGTHEIHEKHNIQGKKEIRKSHQIHKLAHRQHARSSQLEAKIEEEAKSQKEMEQKIKQIIDSLPDVNTSLHIKGHSHKVGNRLNKSFSGSAVFKGGLLTSDKDKREKAIDASYFDRMKPTSKPNTTLQIPDTHIFLNKDNRSWKENTLGTSVSDRKQPQSSNQSRTKSQINAGKMRSKSIGGFNKKLGERKYMGEVKRITETEGSGRKVTPGVQGTRVESANRLNDMTRKEEMQQRYTQGVLKSRKTTTNKKRCSNCFMLLARGFSTANCPYHPQPQTHF